MWVSRSRFEALERRVVELTNEVSMIDLGGHISAWYRRPEDESRVRLNLLVEEMARQLGIKMTKAMPPRLICEKPPKKA